MIQTIALTATQVLISWEHLDRSIQLVAQVHYIKPNEVAHVDVYGCGDAGTQRSIQSGAVMLLQELGIRVELIGVHDVFTLSPDYSDLATLREYDIKLGSIASCLRTCQPKNNYVFQSSTKAGAYVYHQTFDAISGVRRGQSPVSAIWASLSQFYVLPILVMCYHKPMHMNDVIKMMAPRFGTEARAHAWYRSESLPGFDGRTAMQLVNGGEAQQVLDYLCTVDAGVYA